MYAFSNFQQPEHSKAGPIGSPWKFAEQRRRRLVKRFDLLRSEAFLVGRLPVDQELKQVANGSGNLYMKRSIHDGILELLVGIYFHADSFRAQSFRRGDRCAYSL